MMHDLKNAIAQLQLVVSNAERHKTNPAFVDDMIMTVGNAVKRMNGLIDHLRDSGRTSVARETDVAPIVKGVAMRCADRQPVPALSIEPESCLRVHADADRLSTSLEHVVRNAQDASRAGGQIGLEVTAVDGQVRIVISDAGDGMTSEFLRQRLFRPFDGTKGSKGMGIGAYQVREYVESIGGVVKVHSSPGRGTRFEIRLPLAGSGGVPA